jgi:hypothetical protein
MLNSKYKFNGVMKLSDRIESINLLRIQSRANSLAISMESNNTEIMVFLLRIIINNYYNKVLIITPKLSKIIILLNLGVI